MRVNGVLELHDVLPEEINNIIIFGHQTFVENIMQCYDIIGQVLYIVCQTLCSLL